MPLPSQREVAHRDRSRFRVLTVCTGNICRSPQAAMLLSQRLGAAFVGSDATRQLSVESAGTLGFDGSPMDAPALTEARRLGIAHPEVHRARRIQPAYVERADLILGMSREHRGAAASLLPSANRRAFALVEFARIVEVLAARELESQVAPLGAEGFASFMHGVVEAAGRMRGVVPALARREDYDIIDPYRLQASVYRESADAVAAWTARTVDALVSLAAQSRPSPTNHGI